MFDISGTELFVIGVVALIVIGPKELPGLLRTVGNAMGKVRRMAGEFRAQFDEAMREAELDKAKQAFTEMNDAAQAAKPVFNPLDTIRNEIQSVKDEMRGVANAAQTRAEPAASPPPAVEPKLDPPPPPPPVDLAPPPAAAETPEPQPKPRRARKTADGEGAAA